MSGEVKTYRMNSPMKFEEFRTMPEDLQKAYILAVRDKYHVSDTKIFTELLGISQSYGKKIIIKLGIGTGRGVKRGTPDLEGWRKWLRGADEAEEAVDVVEQEAEPFDEFEEEPIVPAEDSDEAATDGFAEKVAEAFARVSESTKKVGMALNAVCDRLEEAVAAEQPTAAIAPVSGSLTFGYGNARQALDTIGMILSDANVRLTVTWSVDEGEA